MKRSQLCLVLLLLLSLDLGCRRASPDACLTNCQTRSKELGCKHPERCLEQCEKARTAVACKTQMDAFMKCALTQPKEKWVCTGKDIPGLTEEACETEQAKVMRCLIKSNGKL